MTPRSCLFPNKVAHSENEEHPAQQAAYNMDSNDIEVGLAIVTVHQATHAAFQGLSAMAKISKGCELPSDWAVDQDSKRSALQVVTGKGPSKMLQKPFENHIAYLRE